MKNDETFIDCFLNFVNDKNANARAAEARFAQHPFCAGRLHIFQTCPDKDDYKELRQDMLVHLAWAKGKLTVSRKKKIAERLNDLALKIPLVDADKKPLDGPDGKPLVLKIGGLLNFTLKHRSVEAIAEPAVTGMEYAGWYALLLISRAPHRIKRCALESCDRYFNQVSTGTVGYCTRKHGKEAEVLNSRNRSWNSRNPDDLKKIRIATAPKTRKKARLSGS